MDENKGCFNGFEPLHYAIKNPLAQPLAKAIRVPLVSSSQAQGPKSVFLCGRISRLWDGRTGIDH